MSFVGYLFFSVAKVLLFAEIRDVLPEKYPKNFLSVTFCKVLPSEYNKMGASRV